MFSKATTHQRRNIRHVPVLIVGAGPAGLVTAIGLARHGVSSMIVERHPATSIFPRATGVSVRSMEIFRSYGLDEDVRRAGWRVKPVQATVRRLDDESPVESPLGFPSDAEALALSPTTAAVSPQDHLEPVLVDHHRALGRGEIRFSTELVALTQDAAGVTADVRDRRTGAVTTVRTRYLVGADGARSTVRARLGIEMIGSTDLGRFMSVLFRADLGDVLGVTRYGLYVIDDREDLDMSGPSSPVLVPSGADDRFVLGIPLPPGTDDETANRLFPIERCAALIRTLTDRPNLEIEILATQSFAFAAQVATRVQDGRAFLVGDAAHRMTPRGGRGMNTAIADGFDLAWKLAWAVRGIAGPALVDAYAAERGPIGHRNVLLSTQPAGGGSDNGLAEDLGTVVRSAVIVDDGSTDQESAAPVARAGMRAPHSWLTIGTERVSTLDLFGRELVLLTRGNGADWRRATKRLSSRWPGLPIRVRPVGGSLSDAEGAFAERYGLAEGGAVLVRPDGIVAWRCPTAPDDHDRALSAAVAICLGHGTTTDHASLRDTSAAPAHTEVA